MNLFEFLEHSTIHGLPLIAFSKTVATRAAWIILVTLAFCAALYFTTSVIIQFNNQPTSTAIVVRNPKEGIDFPNLVICALVRLSKRRAAQYRIRTREQAEYLYASFGPLFTTLDYNVDYFEQRILTKVEDIEMVDQLLLANRTVYELFEKISFTCEDIITGCRLEGELISNCCKKIARYITREGPCFHLRLLDDFYQTRPGRGGGFRIDLHIPADDIIPTIFNSFYERGVLVYQYPLAAARARDPIVVALGANTVMQFHATKYSNVPLKDKPCVNTDEKELKNFKAYGFSDIDN